MEALARADDKAVGIMEALVTADDKFPLAIADDKLASEIADDKAEEALPLALAPALTELKADGSN